MDKKLERVIQEIKRAEQEQARESALRERNQWWDHRIAEIEAQQEKEWKEEQKKQKIAEAADEVMQLVEEYVDFRLLRLPLPNSPQEILRNRIRDAVINYISLGVDN